MVVIHAAGAFYALDDVCTHDGGPLSEGQGYADAEVRGPVDAGSAEVVLRMNGNP